MAAETTATRRAERPEIERPMVAVHSSSRTLVE